MSAGASTTRENSKPTLWQYGFVAVSLFVLWLLLAGNVHRQEIVAGAIVAMAITLIFATRLKSFSAVKVTPLLPLFMLQYLGVFAVALVKANLDLARRVLTPSLPINPRIIKLETRLQSELGRFVLANTITLTPGTLTLDINDQVLTIHWVAPPPGITHEQARKLIIEPFEKPLLRMLS